MPYLDASISCLPFPAPGRERKKPPSPAEFQFCQETEADKSLSRFRGTTLVARRPLSAVQQLPAHDNGGNRPDLVAPAFSPTAQGPVYGSRSAASHRPAALCASVGSAFSPSMLLQYYTELHFACQGRNFVLSVFSSRPGAGTAGKTAPRYPEDRPSSPIGAGHCPL